METVWIDDKRLVLVAEGLRAVAAALDLPDLHLDFGQSGSVSGALGRLARAEIASRESLRASLRDIDDLLCDLAETVREADR